MQRFDGINLVLYKLQDLIEHWIKDTLNIGPT